MNYGHDLPPVKSFLWFKLRHVFELVQRGETISDDFCTTVNMDSNAVITTALNDK